MRSIKEKIKAHQKYLAHPWQFWNKARFVGQSLKGADFEDCDLRGADFRGAKFGPWIQFTRCDLRNANFKGAELEGTEFVDCRFSDNPDKLFSSYTIEPFVTNKLRYNVDRHYDSNKRLIDSKPEIIIYDVKARDYPKEKFYGYKIVETGRRTEGNTTTYKLGLATLYINPKDGALVYSGYKCRCAKAFVLSIKDEDDVYYNEGYSVYTRGPCAKYKVCDYVVADSFDDTWDVECSNGIHFFMSEQEAWDYVKGCG